MREVRLAVGETTAGIEIQARLKSNSTGILVAPGERYAFKAKGEWIDSVIRTDPDGFPSDRAPAISRWLLRAFESKRRFPSANWFCLIGTIGRDTRDAFRIGSQLAEWNTGALTGELLCFANDVAFAYGNNRGSITLTVERLR